MHLLAHLLVASASLAFTSAQSIQQSTQPVPLGYSYIGCYTDSAASRGLTETFQDNVDGNTALDCAAFCGNTIYFGLEFGPHSPPIHLAIRCTNLSFAHSVPMILWTVTATVTQSAICAAIPTVTTTVIQNPTCPAASASTITVTVAPSMTTAVSSKPSSKTKTKDKNDGNGGGNKDNQSGNQ